jgi:phosphohistidine phosphatase
MKKLYLLRHAKSSWEDASLADFDRPLNKRGRRAAPLMGELMRREGFTPDAIVSSPAARAKATAEMVREAGELRAEIVFDERIYEASPARLRDVAAETSGEHRSIMLVGHNPGMEGFIHYLTGELESMPTAALAVINLRIDKWNGITADCAELVEIYRPKDMVL